MRTLLSTRRFRFYQLIRDVGDCSTSQLKAFVTDPAIRQRPTGLFRLACLRTLICRYRNGQPSPQRKTSLRFELGIPNPRWVAADGRTKDLLDGAVLMATFFSDIHAPYDMTICEYADGRIIPVHGMVKMPPVSTIAEAKAVLLNYWMALPAASKERFEKRVAL